MITTGEGGAVVTDSDDLFEKLKLIRSHGRAETSDYFSTSEYLDYVTLGYNFRMSNITAALGISQLKKVDRIIGMRRRNADRMSRGLSQTEGISLLQNPGNFFQVYQMYTIMVDEGQDKRDALARYLADKGIMTKVYFSPVHLSHFYRNELNYNCELPVTEKLSNQVLTLPMYPTLTDDEIDYVVDAVRSFFIEV